MIARHISSALLAALGDSPVVLLHGARQTGKSTLVRHIASVDHPAEYLTLDDATVLEAATRDPAGFLARFGGPIALDEVQKAPGLFIAIKADVDRNRRPGRYLLTGSANVLMLPKLSESLAGRMEILALWPMSQGELIGRQEDFIDRLFEDKTIRPSPEQSRKDGADLLERVLRGGYPEAQTRPAWDRRRAWFDSYVQTILHRDVKDLANVEGLVAMPRMLALLASRVGSLLNLAEMSRGLGLPRTTLDRYMALLEATFLVQKLPAWSGNLGKRLVRSPTLPERYGPGRRPAGPARRKGATTVADARSIVENFVVMELRKQAGWSRTKPGLYHFRTLAGQEVDLVLESPSRDLVGIEIKAAAAVNAGDFKGLNILAEQTGACFVQGLVLYQGREAVSFGRKLHAAPISMLWGQ